MACRHELLCRRGRLPLVRRWHLRYWFCQPRYGDIQEALENAPGVQRYPDRGTFTGNDLIAGLTFAHEFTDDLSIGVTAKYLEEKLFVYSPSSVAFDVGTFYDTGSAASGLA